MFIIVLGVPVVKVVFAGNMASGELHQLSQTLTSNTAAYLLSIDFPEMLSGVSKVSLSEQTPKNEKLPCRLSTI